MWSWAIINEKTGDLVEEGIVFEEDARKLAEELNAVHPNGIYESIVWEIGKLCRQVLD